jgi:PKD repeat protein
MTAASLVLIALVVLVFRLGNQASAGVSLDDPVVWIEDGARGQVLQINGSTLEITAKIDVGDPGDSIIAVPKERDAVFFNRTSGAIGTIGAVSLGIDNEDVLETTNGPVVGDDLQLLADFDASSEAFIIDDELTLVVEPGSDVQRFIGTPDGIGDTAVDADGRLLVVTSDGRQLLISGEQGLELFALLPEPVAGGSEQPQIVRAGDDTFVVDPERRTVNRVDEEGTLDSPTCVSGSLSNVLVGGTSLTNTAGLARVLVFDPVAGVLSVSEPDRSDCYSIEVDTDGTTYGAPVAVDGTAYLPNYDTGQIEIIDLDERLLLRSESFSSVEGRPFELEVFDNAVWANEPLGQLASVVTRDGVDPFPKVSRVIFNGENEDSGDGSDTIFAEGDGDAEERSFGEAGEDVAGDGTTGAGGVGTGAEGAEGAGEESFEGTGLDEPVDNPGIVVSGVDAVVLPNQLSALFTFSADTVSVGETVRFTDTSSGLPAQWNWTFGDGSTGSGPEVDKAWDTEGTYEVTLLISNELGETSDTSVEITVVAADLLRAPGAQFTLDSSTAEVGQVITFQNQSTGEPDSLIWDFGDGTQDAGDVVEHSYASPGTFVVTLTATNAAGSDVQDREVIIVDAVQPPEAVIGSAGLRSISTGFTLTLTSESTNSPTRLTWDFDDGTTDSGVEVRHSWTRPGTYRVRLTAENSAGSSTTFTDVVVSNPVVVPVARFDQSSLDGFVGEPITFGDISLNNPSRVSWEFGDGTTASEANVSKTWDTSGTYSVTLTASNDAGSDTVTKTVTILPPPPDPPVAAFRASAAIVPVNSVVNFADQSTNDPSEWSWDFGDGSTSSAKNPPHAFSAPGTYTVSLTVSNVSGSNTTTQDIIVIDPPTASFSQAIDELEVSFTNTSANSPDEWAWDFGDGTSSSVENPTKTYLAPGTYTVTLTVSNDAGTSAPFTSTVTVAEAPSANFLVTENGLSVTLTDTSLNNPTFWTWDFGDGTTSNQQSPTHTFAAAGTYTISLTASNSAGVDVDTTTVTVAVAPPVADFVCTVNGAGVSCNGSTSAGAETYTWSAPDAIVTTGLNTATPTFTFPSSGDYDITLEVANTSAITDSDTQTVSVVVLEPPVVTGPTVVSNVNGVVELTASATNDPTSWTWDPGGGTVTQSSTGPNSSDRTIQFNLDGDKTIKVFASNAAGDSVEKVIVVNVNVIDLPDVTITNLTNNAGTISATATATNTPVTWEWFIDGVLQPGNNSASVTLNVASNGTYDIRAEATNDDGTGFDADDIMVGDIAGPPPTVDNIAENANANGVVSLTATGSNVDTWSWTVPGGASISGGDTASPTYTFTMNGSYTVTATVTNDDGTATADFTINVTDGPNASFTVATGGPGGLTATFTDTSTNTAGATYSWNFGDGNSGNVASPSHTYAAGGTYTVTLTVTSGGLSSSFMDIVDVP